MAICSIKNFNLNYFDVRIIDYEENEFYVYVGKYGEDLMFNYIEETNEWYFGSLVLNVFDISVTDEGKLLLLIIYCLIGIKNFDIKNINCRDIQSAKLIRKLYDEYEKTNSLLYLNYLKKEVENVCYYIKSKRKFIDLIIAGYDKSLKEVSKRKIDLLLKIRKRSIKKEKEEKRKEKLKWKNRMKRSKKKGE